MLSIPSAIRIFIARDAVDFRKAHDGLLALVHGTFGEDAFEGSLFVFLNRRRDRVKLLQWDSDGFWLHYKRLEQGTFRLRITDDKASVQLTRAQLAMLLAGIDMEKQRIRKPFVRHLRSSAQSRAM